MADPRLTDQEIHLVAERMRDAMRRPLSSDSPDALPAERRVLGREDEDRVTVALAAMRDRPTSAGSDHTAAGTATMTAQGYGTSQGASGAAAGGADPGGSTGSPPG
jgi:hypothetical protein